MAELPSTKLRNLPMLMDITHEPCCLNTLLRWFWLGESQSALAVEGLCLHGLYSLALECGLLRQEGASLLPRALLVHFEGYLLASDHPRTIDQEDAGLVLWPNPTSRLLARFAVRRPSRATLDSGDGKRDPSLGRGVSQPAGGGNGPELPGHRVREIQFVG